MAIKQEHLERPLTRAEQMALRNKRTGMTIFQLSWILVFVCLVLVYFQMRSSTVAWPPDGAAPAGLLPGLAMSAALLVSGVLTWRGLKMAREASVEALIQPWTVVVALGAAFVVTATAQWLAVDGHNSYGMVFRVMVGYHLVHAVVVGLYLLSVLRSARAGQLSQRDLWPAEAAARLWYFVVVAWVVFFVPLYLV